MDEAKDERVETGKEGASDDHRPGENKPEVAGENLANVPGSERYVETGETIDTEDELVSGEQFNIPGDGSAEQNLRHGWEVFDEDGRSDATEKSQDPEQPEDRVQTAHQDKSGVQAVPELLNTLLVHHKSLRNLGHISEPVRNLGFDCIFVSNVFFRVPRRCEYVFRNFCAISPPFLVYLYSNGHDFIWAKCNNSDELRFENVFNIFHVRCKEIGVLGVGNDCGWPGAVLHIHEAEQTVVHCQNSIPVK